jgi:hypothetical protein
MIDLNHGPKDADADATSLRRAKPRPRIRPHPPRSFHYFAMLPIPMSPSIVDQRFVGYLLARTDALLDARSYLRRLRLFVLEGAGQKRILVDIM